MYRCIGCIADVSLMYRFVFCEALSRRGAEYTDVSRVMYRFVSLCIAAIHQIHHDTSPVYRVYISHVSRCIDVSRYIASVSRYIFVLTSRHRGKAIHLSTGRARVNVELSVGTSSRLHSSTSCVDLGGA